MLLKRRKPYVPDLQEMAALCEGNYLRLTRLLPAGNAERTFVISSQGDEARVRLVVDEDHRYTSILSVYQDGLSPGWLQPLALQVRMYHDAGMAEVTSWQNEKRFDGRYRYPNPAMRLPDEKVQLNRFLAEWLSHCMRHGRAQQPVALPGGIFTSGN